MKHRLAVLLAMTLLGTAACGYKGDLYLPGEKPQTSATQTPDAAQNDEKLNKKAN
ncbi:LPS translocon maturation chaperone LptM [Magnetofaba australis]|uniref:LPS translocon maturation chaperone LptM n=1 Tax=Magnetofaba australis TaxID=1472297 RepID=UPI000A19BD8C|nr:lipoprotein [Magnetofaba australis]